MKIQTIYRYPVKSMFGEELESARVDKNGIAGDRHWAIYNLEAREIQGGRNLPMLLQLKARYLAEPTADSHGAIRITFPDGREFETDRAVENSMLDDFLGAKVRVCPLEPATKIAHYARGGNTNIAELRRQMGVEPGEALPDFSSLPVFALTGAAVFSTPPGHYFDVFPLHLITTGALDNMRRLTQNQNFVPHRFRPNIVIANGNANAAEEFSWCGFDAKLGTAQVKIEAETVRCSIPSREQPGVPADKSITRDVAKLSHRHFGVYASVREAGILRTGDAMHLKDDLMGQLQKGIDDASREVRRTVWNFLNTRFKI